MTGISRGANLNAWGYGFDLPEVERVFEEYVAAAGVADRVSFAGGDYFRYTGADCVKSMKEAGFSSTRIEPLPGSDSMAVGIK